MENQKIFKSGYVTKLREDLKAGTSLPEYFKPRMSIPPEGELESAIKINSSIVLQGIKTSNPKERAAPDLENAIALYEAFPDLTEVQASDSRFWTYLTHSTFREYVMARWPIDSTLKEIEADDKLKVSATNHILVHWFAGGNDRILRRNALARLWWAVHLTVAPWERDPQYFAQLKNDDRYIYTRAIFSTQDVFQQVLERGLGRDNRLLISVLDYIKDEGKAKRDDVRDIMKELNLISSIKNVSALSPSELSGLIKSIAS